MFTPSSAISSRVWTIISLVFHLKTTTSTRITRYFFNIVVTGGVACIFGIVAASGNDSHIRAFLKIRYPRAIKMGFPTSCFGFLASILLLALTFAFMYTIVALAYRLFTNYGLPSTIPWAGTHGHNSPLTRARANIASFFSLRRLLDEGYNEHSKHNRTYVLPYFLNGPEVILPPSQIPWLIAQPETILSQDQVNRQFLQAKFVFAHANLVKGPVHPEVIQHQLTRKLGTFIPDIASEMEASLADLWGEQEGEWKEVGMYDTLLDIVTRLSLRVFMGEELCRDQALIRACQSFNRKVALPAAAISMFPELLKPFVAPFFTAYDYIQYLRCRRIILPILRERLQRLHNPESSPADAKPPNDYIQWALEHAFSKSNPDPLELDERVITSRFAVLCFAAIQSSVITLTNTVFDIISSPDREGIMATLREEVLQATTSVNNDSEPSPAAWAKPALARLKHVDSAIRESMRLNGFIQRGVVKMVVAPEGVTLPDGAHIPCGTRVGVSGYSIHRDEDNYADASAYRPFRFVPVTTISDASEARKTRYATNDATSDDATRGSQYPRPKTTTTARTITATATATARPHARPHSLVSTSPTFMGFSHGPHACPGRFFAANQLKIALACIALQYDIAPIGTSSPCRSRVTEGGAGASVVDRRPENKWFFGHMAPPLTAKVLVHRRGRGRERTE